MPPKTTYRRKRSYGKKRKYVKKGLNKTEVKQVKTLVKKSVNGLAESKYFHVRDIFELGGGTLGLGMLLENVRLNDKSMMVLGFSTGTGARLDGLSSYKYGYEAGGAEKSIQAIQMGRIFDPTSNDDFEKQQSIIGQYCNPQFAQTEWNLQRLPINADELHLDPDLSPEYSGIPYQLRIIRVCPRVKKGSYQDVDPKYDLFVDQFGREQGIANATFKQYQLLTYKINSRKYQVKMDIMPRMSPPLVTNSVFDYVPGTPGISTQVQQVNQTNSMISYKFKHDIGKKLYYANPDVVQNPTDGFRPEFIFFHAIPIGGQNQQVVGRRLDDLRLCCKAVGTFKDM